MPDYSKLAKGLTSFVKGATKPVRTFRTPDGYTFHELPNGKIVDNLDPAKVDMSWPNAKVFQQETGAFQLGDELGARKAMIESYGTTTPEKLPEQISKSFPDNPYAQFLRAYNKQNAPKPEPKLKSVKTTGGLNNVKGTQDILPAAEREANKARFLAESRDPRLFYHATDADIPSFIPRRNGTFVTPSTKFANSFVDNTKTGANVMPVRVQVKNPFDYENSEHIDALRKMAFKDSELSAYTRNWLEDEIDALSQIEGMSKTNNNWASIEHHAIQKLIKDMGYDSYYTSEFGTKNLSVYDPRDRKSVV